MEEFRKLLRLFSLACDLGKKETIAAIMDLQDFFIRNSFEDEDLYTLEVALKVIPSLEE